MEWIRYDIHTNTKILSVIGDILAECNIAGYEISDHVPLSRKDEQRMYTGIPASRPDDGSSVLTFYTEAPNNSEKEFFSTGSSIRDDGMADTSPICEPEEIITSILEKIKDMRAYYPLQIPKISYCIQDDSLWKNKWKENFKAFYVTDNIIVKPSWEEPQKILNQMILSSTSTPALPSEPEPTRLQNSAFYPCGNTLHRKPPS